MLNTQIPQAPFNVDSILQYCAQVSAYLATLQTTIGVLETKIALLETRLANAIVSK